MREFVRKHVLLILVLVSLLSGGLGVVASRFVKSPQQVALEQEPAPAAVLTAVVSRGALETKMAIAGSLGMRSAAAVSVAGFSGDGIVTSVGVKPGDVVEEGVVLFELNARPVFGFQSALPIFRDIKPGMSGPDVKAVQEMLQRQGFDDVELTGRYDSATDRALRGFYTKRGYEPVIVGEDEYKAATDALKQATRAEKDAETTLKRAIAAQSEAKADTKADTTDKSAAATSGETNNYAVADARTALSRAQSDRKEAQQTLDKASKAMGASVPRAEWLAIEKLPAAVRSVTSVQLGKALDDKSSLSLGDEAPVINVEVSLAVARDLRQGMKAIITDASGATSTGTVDSILSPKEEGGNVPVVIALTQQAASLTMSSPEVNVEVVVSSSKEELFLVPLSALVTQADGTVVVNRKRSGGAAEQVPVTVAESNDTMAGVNPLTSGELAEGDEVVVS